MGKWVYMTVIGILPSVGGAFFLSPLVKKSFTDPYWAGLGFILTGCYLLSVFGKVKKGHQVAKKYRTFNWFFAFIVGLSQVLAFFPGMSRSGWTITTALLLGFSKKEAVLLSFLLSIPAIIGGMVFELFSYSPQIYENHYSIRTLLLAFLSAWLFGWLFLKVLIHSLEKALFPYFVLYLWPLGFVTLFFL